MILDLIAKISGEVWHWSEYGEGHATYNENIENRLDTIKEHIFHAPLNIWINTIAKVSF